MVGAGAGIGGNGGSGGMPSQSYIEASEGGDGENCGIVNIYNSVTITAIGGAGGSSGVNLRDNAGNSGSGTGAGGYPAARNRWRSELVEALEIILMEVGGYSGGSCENDRKYAQYHNGQCEIILNEETALDGRGNKEYYYSDMARDSAGGGYFQKGVIGPNVLSRWGDVGCNIGGQGAAADADYDGLFRGIGPAGKTGSGGYAGQGGNVTVSRRCTINAYNGNECTLDENNENYYYKPLEIDIQDGVCRDLYFVNYTPQSIMDKLQLALGLNLENWSLATTTSNMIQYVIKDSDRGTTHPATSYGYGIGSGAGYVEVSNGTYTVDTTGSMD